MPIARLIGIVEQSGDRVEILHSIRFLLRYPYIHRVLLPDVTHVSSANEPHLILRDIFSLQNILTLLLKLCVNGIQFLKSGVIHSFIKGLGKVVSYIRLEHTPGRKRTRSPRDYDLSNLEFLCQGYSMHWSRTTKCDERVLSWVYTLFHCDCSHSIGHLCIDNRQHPLSQCFSRETKLVRDVPNRGFGSLLIQLHMPTQKILRIHPTQE